MAELTLSCPKSAVSSTTTSVNVQRRVLIRTGGCFEQNTVLDITNPGVGWVVLGDDVTFSGAEEFVELTQVYRNGQLQLTAESATDDNDVYFVSVSGNIAFEMNVQKNDVVQVWKYDPAITSG